MKDLRTEDQKKGQDGTCATVTVKGADGKPMVINAHDYDEDTHGEILKPVKAAAKAAEATESSNGFKSKTKAELVAHLDEKKFKGEYSMENTKDELVALCEELG